MENVDRSLQEISHKLQALLHVDEQSHTPSSTNSSSVHVSMPPVHTPDSVDGYWGASSFKAHALHVSDALREVASSLDLSVADQALPNMALLDNHESSESTGDLAVSPGRPYSKLQARAMPPIDQTLALIRLANTEKQRIFIDVPVIDEQEFGQKCQHVYFAIDGYSLHEWIIVNTTLYYLFLGLAPRHIPTIGATGQDIDRNLGLLTENIELGMQDLRLCHPASMDACRALAFLNTYCNRTGRRSLAWNIISAASRMCIDLGWHRLPNDPEELRYSKELAIFWHIFVHDKGMAFTLGRTPSMPHYDVTTKIPAVTNSVPVVLRNMYMGFVENAILMGEMHLQLFSASAQRMPPERREESARSLASKLMHVHSKAKKGMPPDDMYQPAAILLDLMLQCLLTITWRIVPGEQQQSSPLKCHPNCTQSARQALSIIVQYFKGWDPQAYSSWASLLNMLFSLVPFAAFVVLAGETIASTSSSDLDLLADTVEAIKPIASSSVSSKKLVNICKDFYQIAHFFVTRSTTSQVDAMGLAEQEALAASTNTSGQPVQSNPLHPLGWNEVPAVYAMAPQAWEAVSNEMDLEFEADAVAMASFIEPYMPLDRRSNESL
ncbi:hypothetical protein B0I35DRAFT_513841 [Stachybotrys elegans]|uniref:Xylanolytic transcriptional activator regulatory domain-containing protein n=1 Tax=Stachybotrys elegans TaxID=80388 RepID=A0A8K0SKZ6_9HYPO|nr:hypothetical protein B0I35DRAFT_513841 [Stachybotrys elegans]